MQKALRAGALNVGKEMQLKSATKDTKWQLITELIVLLFKMWNDTLNANELENPETSCCHNCN